MWSKRFSSRKLHNVSSKVIWVKKVCSHLVIYECCGEVHHKIMRISASTCYRSESIILYQSNRDQSLSHAWHDWVKEALESLDHLKKHHNIEANTSSWFRTTPNPLSSLSLKLDVLARRYLLCPLYICIKRMVFSCIGRVPWQEACTYAHYRGGIVFYCAAWY